MRCPACNKTVEPDAWLCPFCEHIIDPSVLAPAGEDDDLEASEPTKMVPMPPPPAQTGDEPLPDAMILGDVGIAEDEFAVVQGAGVQSNGKTSTFLYYATGASTRVVHPDAVPRLTKAASEAPRTPYEDFILSCIDGARSVRAIQKASGLQPQEVVVTLLTLMDKGAVEIRTADGGPGASLPDGRAPDPDAPTDTRPAAPRQALARARRRSRRDRTPPPDVTTAPLDAAEKVDTQATALPSAEQIREAKASAVPEGFDEDLPSVSDFHEISEFGTADVPELSGDIDLTQDGDVNLDGPALPAGARLGDIPEEPTQLGEPPPAPDDPSSLSDVWAENPSGAMDAEAFIEDEHSIGSAEAEDDWGPLTGPLDEDDPLDDDASLAPVVPSALEPPPDDSSALVMPSDLDPPPDDSAAQPVMPSVVRDFIEESMGPPPSADAAALGVVIPAPLDADEEPDVTKEVFIPAKLRPARPADRPASMPLDRPRSAVVSPSVSAPEAPMLDAALLRPAEPSVVAPAPRPRSLADVVKRGPVEERDRRRPGKPSAPERERPDAPKVVPVEAPGRAEPAAPEPEPKAPADPVDNVRMMKAQKLYEQALQDKADGNVLSARMNMKLAITFDPGNALFQAALEELEASPSTPNSGPGPTGRSKAREYYDAATEAENQGDVDEAIVLLEKAISQSKQAAFLNRLGVVLAMKKQEFVRAQALIEEAIELAPGNATYERNLHKILSRAATADMGNSKGKEKKGGLLGFLGRRK